MNRILIISFLMSLFFLACEEDKKTSVIDEKWKNTTKILTVKLDKLKVRKEANTSAEVIDTLGIGNILFDLEEVGTSLTLGSIDSIVHWEPWLKVETETGVEGWVYAGGIDFSKRENLLIKKRATTLLGKTFYKEILAYEKKYDKISTAEDFAENYRLGIRLRDSMVAIVDDFLEEMPIDVDMPDLFWLEEVLPGFIPQLVAEGTRYYLFADYKQWAEKGKESKDNADDDYITICFAQFPTDSIEYFFSAWMLQTWDYGGHSLLGRGIHLNLLTSIDTCMQESQLFKSELLDLKHEILDDITVDDITYWESKEKILKEVKEILSSNISLLTKEDKIALEVRLTQFETPQKYNVKLNLVTGSE